VCFSALKNKGERNRNVLSPFVKASKEPLWHDGCHAIIGSRKSAGFVFVGTQDWKKRKWAKGVTGKVYTPSA
jgi:hypothetical protein